MPWHPTGIDSEIRITMIKFGSEVLVWEKWLRAQTLWDKSGLTDWQDASRQPTRDSGGWQRAQQGCRDRCGSSSWAQHESREIKKHQTPTEKWKCSCKNVKIYIADTDVIVKIISLLSQGWKSLWGSVYSKCVASNCDIGKKVPSILSTWGPRTNLNWVKYNGDCIMCIHRKCILLNISCALLQF